ncbi:carboxypeptidase regulatory-like domain-containing protein [Qipengyuania aurantiaca]|uniref:Carboxypeptidase regulatory-like domain-containing protein n=1 Tax=Qipengyuania aurantiaca TaxID=2867233 RepID=A0ABX8ZIJ9_9SPHN|nr:TonB-dependent receptor [Qipengyuania aurantiaca]QZD88825.1 carboxypeptidase regulatory-like domain-containing protein [Qipengyuania aurantiaca]
MKFKYLLAASAVSLAATGAIVATPAAAQQITSGIEGQVVGDTGAAISGASITVTDTRTGQSRTLTSDADGSFRVGSLPPGGPYTVTATAAGFEGQTVENIFINISGNTEFTFELSQGAAENVIVVTGARANVQQLAVGPGTAFGSDTLEDFPSITRDVRDIIRLDPRVSLERDNDVDRISCLGGNDRANTFTVDGIVQSDVFGLNGTPFASRNSLPLPFDVIEQTSVEFAPYDVEYSDFTGCLVNVVTKSGTNKFHGSAFYTYFDESLQNNEVEFADGTVQEVNAGREERWGATLNGPIIPDRLFFSLGYEEVKLQDGFNEGPFGSGAANEVNFVTQAQFERFAQIARDVYGQDIGGAPQQLPEGNVRYFGRLDAIINDDHRLEATYQRLEETNVEQDTGDNTFTGYNSFEDEGTISDYYSARLYSNWSDTVSTELRLSRAEVGDVQGPVGFNEAQAENPTVRLVVGIDNASNGLIPDGDDGGFATGPGIFRSANQLDTKIDQARFIMNIDGGDHQFKLGAELNDLEVYNLFAINATGTLFFNGLDDFEQGLLAGGSTGSAFSNPDDIVTGGAGGGTIATGIDGDINNAAARFSRQIWSFFAQDEWQATDQLSLAAGLRVQLYDGDAPRANPLFLQRYGFTNANPFSRIDPVLLPRVAATYELDNDGLFSNTRLTAGVGLFAGADPVVYFSNAFSNDGFSYANGDTGDCDASELTIDPATGQIDVVTGGSFNGIPQCAIDAAAADAGAGRGEIQSTDPDFDIPTVVRANLGLATDFGTETGFFSNWRLNLDYIYSRYNDTLAIVDLTQVVDTRQALDGFTIDGRPIIAAIDPLADGCNAVFVGNQPPTYTGVTDECFNTGIDEYLQLTNGPSFDSHNASILLSKRFDGGLITDGGTVNFSLGYAFSDSEQTINARSSTAGSTFDGTAVFDPQNPAISQSGFETRHNIVLALNLREQFFDGYDTGLGIFFRASEGRPYSLVFDDEFPFFRDSGSAEQNILAYIPTGFDDPNIAPPEFDADGNWTRVGSDPVALQRYLDALNGEGIVSELNCEFTRGQTIERNTCRNPWFFDLDLRLSQELPFIGSFTGVTDDSIELYVDFDNFLNLLDSGWNVRRSLGDFDGRVDLVDATYDSEGRYVIRDFNAFAGQAGTSVSSSIWRIQVGARYKF